jgi:hypothetical protein
LLFKKQNLCTNLFKNFIQAAGHVALLLLIIAANALIGMLSKEFTARDRKIAPFGLIGIHIQLLVGMVLYLCHL